MPKANVKQKREFAGDIANVAVKTSLSMAAKMLP
jgi:hypothetical protein